MTGVMSMLEWYRQTGGHFWESLELCDDEEESPESSRGRGQDKVLERHARD